MKNSALNLVREIVTFDPQDCQKIIEIVSNEVIDWGNLFLFSQKHKIVSLVYYYLCTLRLVDKIPFKIRQLYYKYDFYNRYKLTYLLEELERIVAVLNKEGLQYALVKGFSLDSKLCPRKFLREFGDIDILVNSPDIERMKTILSVLGYCQGEFDYQGIQIRKSSKQEKLYWRLYSHQIGDYVKMEYVNSLERVSLVDVNFTIFRGGKEKDFLSINKMLENGVIYQINDTAVQTLCPTDEFIQICYHFYKDAFYDVKKASDNQFVLLRFYDIYQYVKRFGDKIDWSFIRGLSSDVKSGIFFTLYTINHFCMSPALYRIIQNEFSGMCFDDDQVLFDFNQSLLRSLK